MSIQELINDLQQHPNSQSEVEFLAMFEYALYSSGEDQSKEVQLRFKDASVSSRHPNIVQITLH